MTRVTGQDCAVIMCNLINVLKRVKGVHCKRYRQESK